MHDINPLAVLFFVVGLAMHTLAQVHAIAAAKNNPANSIKEIYKSRWVTILIRSAWCFAIFILWLQGQLADLLEAFSVPLPEYGKIVLDLHVGAAIAWMAGYSFDSALGYFPKLKTSLPPSLDDAEKDA